MLEAVTFKKELILTIYMPQTGATILWLDPVRAPPSRRACGTCRPLARSTAFLLPR